MHKLVHMIASEMLSEQQCIIISCRRIFTINYTAIV